MWKFGDSLLLDKNRKHVFIQDLMPYVNTILGYNGKNHIFSQIPSYVHLIDIILVPNGTTVSFLCCYVEKC